MEIKRDQEREASTEREASGEREREIKEKQIGGLGRDRSRMR